MPTLKEGQVFERYFVTQWLGSGVSGESYEAKDIVLQQKVTLKLIHPWAPLSDLARRQFFREMQGISQLKHPHLTPVLDYGEINDRLYVTRQHTTSGSLLGSEGRSWFRPPLSIPDAIHYGHQLAQILQYIHNSGQLHGALTFANILVLHSPNSELDRNHPPFLLTDVGLANFVRSFGQPQISSLPITAAPEQLSNRITPASDQFALAALLFSWLAGRPPYLGSPEEVKHLKLTEIIPSLLSFNPRVTIEQEAVLRRALASYPDRRYPSILEFTNALAATLTRQTPTLTLAELDTKFPIEPEPTLAPVSLPEPNLALELIRAPEPLPEPTLAPVSLPEPNLALELSHAPEPLPEPNSVFGLPYTPKPHRTFEALPQSFPAPQPLPDPMPEPVPVPEPAPEPLPVPEPLPLPAPEPLPVPAPEPLPVPVPEPLPLPAPEPLPQPHLAFDALLEPLLAAEPSPEPNPVPWSWYFSEPNPEPRHIPSPNPAPEPHLALELPHIPEPNPAFEPSPTPEPQPLRQTALPSSQETPPTIPGRLIISSPYTEVPTEVTLTRRETTLGRAGSSDIVLDHDAQISRHHALLTCEDDYYIIYDLRSVSGVFVNGQKLMGDLGCILLDGDHVHIGNHELLFHSSTHEANNETNHLSSEANTADDETSHLSLEANTADDETSHLRLEANTANDETSHLSLEANTANDETNHLNPETNKAGNETNHASLEALPPSTDGVEMVESTSEHSG